MAVFMTGCSSNVDQKVPLYEVKNACQTGCLEMGLIMDEMHNRTLIRGFAESEEIKKQCFDSCVELQQIYVDAYYPEE